MGYGMDYTFFVNQGLSCLLFNQALVRVLVWGLAHPWMPEISRLKM